MKHPADLGKMRVDGIESDDDEVEVHEEFICTLIGRNDAFLRRDEKWLL
jgi:hypothetical protein